VASALADLLSGTVSQTTFIVSLTGMLMRPAKCEAEANAEARYHKAEAEVETKAKKCAAEARDTVLTINY